MNRVVSEQILAELESKIVDEKELQEDFAALWPQRTQEQLQKIVARPSILRKLAIVLSRKIPLGTNRIISQEPAALIIAAAVSLETGIPFSHILDAEKEEYGDLLSSENWVILSIHDPDAEQLIKLSAEHLVNNLHIFTLAGTREDTAGFSQVNLLP